MAFRISSEVALERLTRDCHFEEWRARRILNIAWEFGIKCEPCPGGYVEVQYHGLSEFRDPPHHLFSVIEHIGETPRRKVASGELSDYTQGDTEMPSRHSSGKAITSRRKEMAPKTRARQTAPEPEVAAANGDAEDFGKYLAKDLTDTMLDYVTWFEDNVARLEDVPIDKLLALGSTLYPKFQKSDFNIAQREARRAERETEREPEPETVKPARGTKPATTGRSAKPATSTRPARSGTRSSGRSGSTRSAAAQPDAPF